MLMLSKRYLKLEHAAYRGSGGVSQENRHYGFIPAFRDSRTGKIYASTYADGRPAPVHLVEGLPDELVVARDRAGRPAQVLGTVIAGFTRHGRFYTRDEAAEAIARATAIAPTNLLVA